MSLNWDISKIADKDWAWVPVTEAFGPDSMYAKNDPDSKYLNPKLEAIIWATMAVDMGEITEKNYEEFFQRYVMWCIATEQHENALFEIYEDEV